jgi:hypothetical protein
MGQRHRLEDCHQRSNQEQTTRRLSRRQEHTPSCSRRERERVIKRLPQQFNESKDGCHYLELLGEDMEWTSTLNRLAETAPVHRWEPILAALHTAEVEQATKDTTKLHQREMKELDKGQEHRFTDSKVSHAHTKTEELTTKKTKRHGSRARAFNLTEQVMNRWTTSPLPSTETWIRAAEQDPDLQLLTQAMKEKTTPLKLKFMPGLSTSQPCKERTTKLATKHGKCSKTAKESRAEERTLTIRPRSHHDIECTNSHQTH